MGIKLYPPTPNPTFFYNFSTPWSCWFQDTHNLHMINEKEVSIMSHAIYYLLGAIILLMLIIIAILLSKKEKNKA